MEWVPSGEIIDVANDHLELASTFGGETGVHLHRHGIRHMSQLRNGGPTLLLQLLDYGRSAGPLAAAPHALPDDQSHRDGAHSSPADDHHRLLPHLI